MFRDGFVFLLNVSWPRFPNARASICARQLASKGLTLCWFLLFFTTPIKSQGVTIGLWCRCCAKLCWKFVPLEPQMIGAVV